MGSSHSDRVTASSRLLQRALAAAAQGFFVFPLVPRGKVPAQRGWQGQATHDPERICGWFRERAHNIGIATGPSRLLVIDLDDAHGQQAPDRWAGARHGRDVLARLAADAGEPVPTDTFSVATPSGGEHRYFGLPDGVALPNSAGTVGWRVDSRGTGGYVVGAGSVRVDGYYRVTNPAPVASIPAWLLRALTPPAAPPARPAPARRLPASRATAYVRAAVHGECTLVTEAVPGTRHRTLLRAARVLGEFVGGGALDLSAAHRALRAAAAQHIGVEGCTEREVEQAILDGLAYGQRRPRSFGRNCS